MLCCYKCLLKMSESAKVNGKNKRNKNGRERKKKRFGYVFRHSSEAVCACVDGVMAVVILLLLPLLLFWCIFAGEYQSQCIVCNNIHFAQKKVGGKRKMLALHFTSPQTYTLTDIYAHTHQIGWNIINGNGASHPRSTKLWFSSVYIGNVYEIRTNFSLVSMRINGLPGSGKSRAGF